MSASENQIVVYQPNETVRLDVRLENETTWLTQAQLCDLFGCSADNSCQCETTKLNHTSSSLDRT